MTLFVVFFIITGAVSYMNTAVQFGAAPKGAHLDRISTSPQFHEGRFRNPDGADVEMSFGNMLTSMYEFITADSTSPDGLLPTGFHLEDNRTTLAEDEFAVTWLGHSAIYLEIDGRRLLLDPMLGKAASPLPIFGKRFALSHDIDLAKVPKVDAVLISHDHYDHLDHETITTIDGRVGHYYVPLGVGAHLRRWGIAEERITELDWWERADIHGIRITATPAQHFSGRGLTDRNRTLWASYAIEGRHARVFFSGDGGYGPHFKEIGERLGPFDLTMMECGQYNEKWHAIHSFPEESVQANLDLRGGSMLPIHWGSFTLAPHPWTEPAERVRTAAAEAGVPLLTPLIGERVIPSRKTVSRRWWKH